MKILVAEDDLSLQQIAGFLMKNWGYDCDIAPNGLKAVELVKANDGKYDLCLMDIDMPIMNGCEATKMIRQKTKYMPIMAMTANFTFQYKYMEAGMDDFLEKPYDPDILYGKINELTVKAVKMDIKDNNLYVIKEIPMNPEELQELRELDKKGLTKFSLIGESADHKFITHKNIQNKISHDFIAKGKKLSEFLDRSEEDPGIIHLYASKDFRINKRHILPENLEILTKDEDGEMGNYKTKAEYPEKDT